MANTFENTDLVTRFAVKHFLNEMQMANRVDRQLDSQYRKVGETINVRRPVMFTSGTGADISSSINDITEGQVPVTLDTQSHVAFEIDSKAMSLNVEDAQDRYIRPAMVELAQKVESAIAGSYMYIPNFVGTPGTTPSTYAQIAAADEVLTRLGVPDPSMWSLFLNPASTNAVSDNNKGLYLEKNARTALEMAQIGPFAGFPSVYKNQSLVNHTVGALGGTPVVNGASQNVTYAASRNTGTQSLVTDGWSNSITDVVKAGDTFTIAGVYEVNRRTRQSTGSLQTFTILADADSDGSGNATLTIAPAMITSGAYQTVDAAPADDAAITIKSGTAATSYVQNMAFHKNAITLAMAPLDLPTAGALASVRSFDNISIRGVQQYDVIHDKTIFRFDILYGVKVQNPDFAVRITG